MKIHIRCLAAAVLIAAGAVAPAGAQKLYDMRMLIAQPHPFSAPRSVAEFVPEAGRAAPLPGSRYGADAPEIRQPPEFRPYATPVPPPQSARAGLAPGTKDRGWIYVPDPPPESEPPFGVIAEARLGVLDHASSLLGSSSIEGGLDISPEILFVSPQILRWVGSPMPHLGARFSTEGYRNMYYGGLTWRVGFLDFMHLEVGFGIGVHDDDLGSQSGAREVKLGCRWLFHETIGLGVTIADRHTITLQAEHFSHAHLCGANNDGLETLGVVYGYRF